MPISLRCSRRELLAAVAAPVYRTALPGYRYEFPRDHFEHPEFRTEWWYYTGNVRGDRGRFGFELVFFRQGERRGSANPSAWRIDDFWLAHLALTDISGGRHLSHKRLNRAGPGIAGARFSERKVWNGNWSAEWLDETGRQRLRAVAPDFSFDLVVRPAKKAVVHGRDGISQKAAGAGKASHYVSFTRLDVSGAIDGNPVTGSAWMDHEWFTHQLEERQTGWDWFSVQLADGRDLMLFQLRTRDGGIDPHSSGTVVDAASGSRSLRADEFTLTPQEWWSSPKTGTRYPTAWSLRVPSETLDLQVRAAIPNQEMIAEKLGGPSYWEGAVEYSGSAAGVGYLEMTGYDKPVDLR